MQAERDKDKGAKTKRKLYKCAGREGGWGGTERKRERERESRDGNAKLFNYLKIMCRSRGYSMALVGSRQKAAISS